MGQALSFPKLPKRYFDCDKCGRTTLENPCPHEERRFYDQGVETYQWQLNEDEMRELYPKTAIKKYGYPKMPCPWCGDHTFDFKDKRTLEGHLRQSHEERWIKPVKDRFAEANTPEELFDFATWIGTLKHKKDAYAGAKTTEEEVTPLP